MARSKLKTKKKREQLLASTQVFLPQGTNKGAMSVNTNDNDPTIYVNDGETRYQFYDEKARNPIKGLEGFRFPWQKPKSKRKVYQPTEATNLRRLLRIQRIKDIQNQYQ